MYTQALSTSQAEELMLPILKGSSVHCALCGRELDRLTPGHIRTHAEYLRSKRGLKWFRPKKQLRDDASEETEFPTDDNSPQWESRNETLMETYERLFGGKDRLSASVKKLFELYQPNRGKWLLMDKPMLPTYATWYQVTSDNPAFRPNRLCVSVLKEHLLLKSTVGVFPKSQYKTHFVTWDIDSHSSPNDSSWNAAVEARAAALAVSGLLRKWGLHPHIVLSGKKGYHVTVFFKVDISIKIAMNLYKAVLHHPDGPRVSQRLKIECLPIERGNKLPLGIHWGSDRYCGFADPYTLEPLLNPYEYLLSITPDNPRILYEIADEGLLERRRNSSVISEKSWSKDATEMAFKVGITAPGTRHDTLVRVGAYIRNTPSLCPDSLPEFIDTLLSWSRKQYEQHQENIGTIWAEHVRDVERVAKYTWTHPLTSGVPRGVKVTAATVHWIRSQTSVLSEQQVLFAAWFQTIQVGDHFHLGYEQVRGLTKLAKDSLDGAMTSLREKGILVVAVEYSNGGNGIIPSQTRKYRFGDPPPTSSPQAILLELTREQWEPTLWFRLLVTLFTKEQLKNGYPFAYHRIRKVEPISLGRCTA